MINKIIKKYRERDAEAKANAIYADFKVQEKGGNIYLTCCGTAFAVMPNTATVAQISELLKKARLAAMIFEDIPTAAADCLNSTRTDDK